MGAADGATAAAWRRRGRREVNKQVAALSTPAGGLFSRQQSADSWWPRRRLVGSERPRRSPTARRWHPHRTRMHKYLQLPDEALYLRQPSAKPPAVGIRDGPGAVFVAPVRMFRAGGLFIVPSPTRRCAPNGSHAPPWPLATQPAGTAAAPTSSSHRVAALASTSPRGPSRSLLASVLHARRDGWFVRRLGNRGAPASALCSAGEVVAVVDRGRRKRPLTSLLP